MITTHLLTLGMAMVGWVLPELAVAVSQGKVRMPVMINIISATGMMFIGAYIEGHLK